MNNRNFEVGKMNLTFNADKIKHPSEIVKAPPFIKRTHNESKYY